MVAVANGVGRLSSIVFMLLSTVVVVQADVGPRKPSEVVDVALNLGSAACTNVGTKFVDATDVPGTTSPSSCSRVSSG